MRHALLLTCFLAGCVVDASDVDSEEAADAIAGGTVVTSGPIARTTVMFVAAGGDGTHGCSASIIDASHALTAGHCLIGLDPGDQPELVFETVVHAGGTRRTVTAFVGAPDSLNNDIAVLTFAGGLPPGHSATAVARQGFTLSPDRTTVTHAGYGQTTADVNDRGTLHRASSTFRRTLKDHRILSSRDGAGICSGDSGGPDYVRRDQRYVQVGVHVSGDCATTTVSTDVRAFTAFLLAQGAQPTFVP
jgi:secreted trypsin-like serine protease